MAAAGAAGRQGLKDYLQRYVDNPKKEEKRAKKKKKKRTESSSDAGAGGVVIVDDDAVWHRQRAEEEAEEEEPEAEGDAPTVIEDVEVKQMKRMEAMKTHRPYLSMGEDGSGWVTVKDEEGEERARDDVDGGEGEDDLGSGSPQVRVLDGSAKRKRSDYPDLSSSRRGKDFTGAGDLSPPRRRYSPDLSPPRRRVKEIRDLSPPLRRRDSPDLSPPRRRVKEIGDFSPPRRRRYSPDLSPPRRRVKEEPRDSRDLSPPRRRRDSPDLSPPRRRVKEEPRDLSPPRRRRVSPDLSPPRRRVKEEETRDPSRPRRRDSPELITERRRHDSPPGESAVPSTKRKRNDSGDLSSPRRRRRGSPDAVPSGRKNLSDDLEPRRRSKFSDAPSQISSQDLSPPRGGKASTRVPKEEPLDLSPPRRRRDSPDRSPPRRRKNSPMSESDFPSRKPINSRDAPNGNRSEDLSPPRRKLSGKMADGTFAGLKSDREVVSEAERRRAAEAKMLSELDPSLSGRGAETVFRDKRGRRLEGLEDLLRQQKGEAKPKEEPLEWGKGLAQKKKAEENFAELEAAKSQPFARYRDDPELDKTLRERMRFGDPMAHLVKQKLPELVLEDLGARGGMKASGFIVPQDIPSHSWLKRGIPPAPNRYSIRPGRHWDGVDRSTGFEQGLFKMKNEKKARELEAYLWSVADM